MAKKKPAMTVDGYLKDIVSSIQKLSYRHDKVVVFTDFLAIAAISLSNTIDFVHKEEREAEYMKIVGKYTKEELELFAQMFGYLIMCLQDGCNIGELRDCLGELFHALELYNKWKGQFFTPIEICNLMGMISAGDYDSVIREKGYATLEEPTVGSGAMVLGFANALIKGGYTYQKSMLVSAVDVDLKCVHMAYIQLSLYGIPAVVIWGNSLTGEEWGRWYTPAYLWDNWIWRERCGITNTISKSDEMIKCAMSPEYYALKKVMGLFETVGE